ncbi:hypothetical protein CAEBREN_11999 [Caenorhabditis brenneri]|uniref:Peptidase M12A domain-containing protein n=1 Tax=Caenorhabditis brenneri TaxID=135651 RepID=G0MNB7_CAEBE|nr:hypothetical protein CAEBREN_11999 [Caenorhabditis brenneri]
MRILILTAFWGGLLGIFVTSTAVGVKKNCKRAKAFAVGTQSGNGIDAVDFEDRTLRKPVQKVYFWPSLTDFEKNVLRDAFNQIGRRTCVKFEEQEYKPWYHADRWDSNSPHVLIRKSGKFAAYSDAVVEGLVDRTILYVAQSSFETSNFNNSRGMVMDQLVRFMGLQRELYRPDAVSYVQAIDGGIPNLGTPDYNPIQLTWPFDPESITVPLWAREKFRLTPYCPARNDADIGAGQRVGLLTKWDTVKLNSMYCPDKIVDADPSRGPCVVPRAKDLDSFKKRLWAYKRLLAKNTKRRKAKARKARAKVVKKHKTV